jgi:hypothetical protein
MTRLHMRAVRDDDGDGWFLLEPPRADELRGARKALRGCDGVEYLPSAGGWWIEADEDDEARDALAEHAAFEVRWCDACDGGRPCLAWSLSEAAKDFDERDSDDDGRARERPSVVAALFDVGQDAWQRLTPEQQAQARQRGVAAFQALWSKLMGGGASIPRGGGGAARADANLSPELAAAMLGLAWPCTADELAAAYKRAARIAHPDAGGSDAAMKKINEARDVLRAAVGVGG